MSNKINTRSKRVGAIMMLMIITVSLICPVYAENSYAKNASDWLMSGIQIVVLIVVAAYSIKHLAKRQFVQFAGFAILAAFILVIVYSPDKLKTVGDYLWGIIFN